MNVEWTDNEHFFIGKFIEDGIDFSSIQNKFMKILCKLNKFIHV